MTDWRGHPDCAPECPACGVLCFGCMVGREYNRRLQCEHCYRESPEEAIEHYGFGCVDCGETATCSDPMTAETLCPACLATRPAVPMLTTIRTYKDEDGPAHGIVAWLMWGVSRLAIYEQCPSHIDAIKQAEADRPFFLLAAREGLLQGARAALLATMGPGVIKTRERAAQTERGHHGAA